MDFFRVIFTDPFLADLEEVVRRVATHDPAAAERLGEVIVEGSESLTFFPERHPQVRQRPGIRRFIVRGRFKIFYRIRFENSIVEILRCWDGHRNEDPTIEDNPR